MSERRAFVVGEDLEGGMALLTVHQPGTAGLALPEVRRVLKTVHVFWELLPDEEKPFQGLPFGTLCALLYDDGRDVILAAVYEHREGEGYPFRWRARLEELPAWLRLACPIAQGGEWRFPEPRALPVGRGPVWAAATLPDPKVLAAAKEAGLGD